jgi:hypothetical protein
MGSFYLSSISWSSTASLCALGLSRAISHVSRRYGQEEVVTTFDSNGNCLRRSLLSRLAQQDLPANPTPSSESAPVEGGNLPGLRASVTVDRSVQPATNGLALDEVRIRSTYIWFAHAFPRAGASRSVPHQTESSAMYRRSSGSALPNLSDSLHGTLSSLASEAGLTPLCLR